MDDNLNDLVLIVDDNPNNIKLLASILNKLSYKTGFAMNGQETLSFLEENIPILILLDIMMPDMSGYEVCQKIKENPKLKDIPIIFLTAKSEKEDIVKGFELGAVDYISKPFNSAELKMRIKNHVELQQNKIKIINLNENLKKANDTKNKFFSIIAHDLRGPIGNIKQYLIFLLEMFNDMTKKEILDAIKTLKDVSDNTYKFLDDLLTWAYSQKETISFNPEKNNLYNLVENNIKLLKPLADKKQIILKSNLSNNTMAIFDLNMINTIIRNLISNSIKYTGKNGEINISSVKKNNFLEITVSDNGIGMKQDKIDNLFRIDIKKFSEKGTEGETGTGLGLILCKEFIDKHQGNIIVESQLGIGSSFTFTVPETDYL